MLGFELKEANVTYERCVEQNTPFFDALKVLSTWFTGVTDQLAQVAIGGSNLQTAAGAIHNHLHNSGISKPIRGSVFWKSAEAVANVLRGLFPNTSDEPDLKTHTQQIADEIQALVELHDTYNTEKNGPNALPLIMAGHALLMKLNEFGFTLNLAANALSNSSPDLATDEEALTLLFSSQQSIRSFWEKLRAIEELYRILCTLFDVREDDHPLRVIKIESGSFWVELAGQGIVIAFMIKLIWAGVGYIHRNYTPEGRIAGSNTKLRTILDDMRLVEEMKRMGVDTSGMKHDLQASAESVTKALSDMLDNESLVKVNNQIYRVEPHFDALPQLGHTDVPRLTDETKKDDAQ